MSIRDEHQKQNQPAIEKWPFGFVFGVQLGLRQTRALIKTKKNTFLQVKQLWAKWGAFTEGPTVTVNAPHLSHNCFYLQQIILLGINQCPCLPKAEWSGRLVLFLVFNSITHAGRKVIQLTWKTAKPSHQGGKWVMSSPAVNAPHLSHNCSSFINWFCLVLISALVCRRPS